jgi:hypothetical protein
LEVGRDQNPGNKFAIQFTHLAIAYRTLKSEFDSSIRHD